MNPFLFAATAMILISCERNEAVSPPPSPSVSTDDFIDATADLDRSNLLPLIAAFDADPVGVADRLERDIGGKAALRRYATAMIEQGRAEHLGRQLARIQSQADALARPEDKDGSTWYPRAEDAGFLSGGVGAVLASHPEALDDFARGAGRPAPTTGEDLQVWLSAPVAALPRPARAAFGEAFRAAAHRPDDDG